MTNEERFKALEETVAKQAETIARLEGKEAKPAFVPEPLPPFDPYKRMMSEVQPWMRDMAAAVPDAVVRAIVADNVRARPVVVPPEVQKPRGSGWVDPVPREIPGLKVLDALMDHADKLDRKRGLL